MARLTQFQPWGYGGIQEGSFAGRITSSQDRRTQFQPWGYGGKEEGSFAGRTGGLPTTQRTQFTPFGYGGRRYGLFSGRLPGVVGRPFTGQISRISPYGYGSRKYGNIGGRVPTLPIANSASNASISGASSPHLILGDPGGPDGDFGYLQVTGTGSATLQVGIRPGTGTGNLGVSGIGGATALSTGTQIATGVGSVGLNGVGAAFGPTHRASGVGGIGINGVGSGASLNAPISGASIQDLINAMIGAGIEGGITDAQYNAIISNLNGIPRIPGVSAGRGFLADDDLLDLRRAVRKILEQEAKLPETFKSDSLTRPKIVQPIVIKIEDDDDAEIMDLITAAVEEMEND